MRELWTRLRAFVDNLAPRERILVGAAAALVAVLLVVVGVVQPLVSASSRAAQRVERAEREVQTMRRLHGRYDELNARLSAVERRIQRGPRGELFTTLEELASQSAVQVDAMEPRTAAASEDYSETKVQVVLKGVTLAQAVNYLHRIESAEQLLSVKSLRIRTRRDRPELLDVNFTVSSFEPRSS